MLACFTCRSRFIFLLCALPLLLTACGGGDNGSAGPPGEPGAGLASVSTATELKMEITSAAINSTPVIQFSVMNQDNSPVAGLTLNDLRFTIAKLVPGSNGAPNGWQNYINTVSNAGAPYIKGNRENNGTLVDNQNGTYTYTFGTDIKNTSQTCPASGCQDANGNTIDTGYNASLTHRVAVQTRGTIPMVNAVYTFIPGSGPVTSSREIVSTAKCNECHNRLQAHDQRIDTQYCVMCHNPGTSAKVTQGIEAAGPATVDFKVMIHKIHYGEHLPSVNDADGLASPGDYLVVGHQNSQHSFKDVVFPQDVRNCTKCHDGTVGAANATTNGDNWKTSPSRAACGSCHDDVYFDSSKTRLPYQLTDHPGGVDQTDDSMCITCHGAGKQADVAVKHNLPGLLKAEAARYKFTINSVTNSTPGSFPTITFSVTDPANAGAAYDIPNTPAITTGSMSLLLGWSNSDINNDGRSNSQPVVISLLSGGALAGTVTDNGDRTYSVTSTVAVPAGATGSGRIGFYGRTSVDVDGNGSADRIPVKSEVLDYAITDSTAKSRRSIVEMARCSKCHDTLSLHGGQRTNEPQLCVMCHNPNATDINRRPRADLASAVQTGPCYENGGQANAVQCSVALDGKREEAIDFKRMIHGIHAGAKSGHGFREKGLVVYGHYTGSGPANPFDFGHVRFPGKLNDCTTCHTSSSYQLTGLWQMPTSSGILSTSITTANLATDSFSVQSDDFNITPTASVCSSCHDGILAQQHMLMNGAAFSATQSDITNYSGSFETCAICHGPGKLADVKLVHGL